MKIILGVSLSKKNYKFLNNFLTSLANLKNNKDCTLVCVFINEKKNFYFENLIKKKLYKRKKFKIV